MTSFKEQFYETILGPFLNPIFDFFGRFYISSFLILGISGLFIFLSLIKGLKNNPYMKPYVGFVVFCMIGFEVLSILEQIRFVQQKLAGN
jgi:hypothetical protein